MPVTFFIQEKRNLKLGSVIPNSHGWWNTIEKADLDGDGDEDFVLGNWGENMKLQASISKPLKLYVNDFDANGKSECILEWQFGADEKAFPFASRKDLTAQLPMLKKNSLKHQEYARKQVKELLPKEAFEKSMTLTTNNFQTSMLLREDLGFELRALPLEAQMSPVYAIEILDVDQDNNVDLVLGGNYYLLKPEIGRLDGFNGGYFNGNGNGDFTFVAAHTSGLKISGEVRDIATLGDHLVFARNNQSIVAFKKEK